jgi:hypothetical protein
MQSAVWCFKGDKWTLGTEYLRLWGARYAPFIAAEPSRSVSSLRAPDYSKTSPCPSSEQLVGYRKRAGLTDPHP